MLYISAFTFGGGFVIITLIKQKFADELGWIEYGYNGQEILDTYRALVAKYAPDDIAYQLY